MKRYVIVGLAVLAAAAPMWRVVAQHGHALAQGKPYQRR